MDLREAFSRVSSSIDLLDDGRSGLVSRDCTEGLEVLFEAGADGMK